MAFAALSCSFCIFVTLSLFSCGEAPVAYNIVCSVICILAHELPYELIEAAAAVHDCRELLIHLIASDWIFKRYYDIAFAANCIHFLPFCGGVKEC